MLLDTRELNSRYREAIWNHFWLFSSEDLQTRKKFVGYTNELEAKKKKNVLLLAMETREHLLRKQILLPQQMLPVRANEETFQETMLPQQWFAGAFRQQ